MLFVFGVGAHEILSVYNEVSVCVCFVSCVGDWMWSFLAFLKTAFEV